MDKIYTHFSFKFIYFLTWYVFTLFCYPHTWKITDTHIGWWEKIKPRGLRPYVAICGKRLITPVTSKCSEYNLYTAKTQSIQSLFSVGLCVWLLAKHLPLYIEVEEEGFNLSASISTFSAITLYASFPLFIFFTACDFLHQDGIVFTTFVFFYACFLHLGVTDNYHGMIFCIKMASLGFSLHSDLCLGLLCCSRTGIWWMFGLLDVSLTGFCLYWTAAE